MAETALEQLSALINSAADSYKHSKNKALRRLRVLTSVSYLIGGLGASILTLQAYNLLTPLLGFVGIQQSQTPGAWSLSNTASIATVLVLAGIALAAWVRNRGYLTQFLRYALATSELQILSAIFKLEQALAVDDAAKVKLVKETAQKFSEIVRAERASFTTDTRQDVDRLMGLVEGLSKTTAAISGKQ